MKLYLAGIYASGIHRRSWYYTSYWNERERAAIDGIRYMLESYHYVKSQRLLDRMRADGVRHFLDSGAYSAFTKGSVIDIREYCNHILRNQDLLAVDHDDKGRPVVLCSVLDAIGDADQTYRNQKIMESLGVVPLPCYHYGEPEDVLRYYLDHYPYITIGGMVPISTPQLLVWLDRIWANHLTNDDGTPKTRVHGFGLTAIPLMSRYPWYSVDSAAWVQKAMFGNIIFPGDTGIVQISVNSPAAKVPEGHYDTLPEEHRAALRAEIESLGFDPDRLRNNRDSRIAFNINSFTLMMDRWKAHTFKATQPVLF